MMDNFKNNKLPYAFWKYLAHTKNTKRVLNMLKHVFSNFMYDECNMFATTEMWV